MARTTSPTPRSAARTTGSIRLSLTPFGAKSLAFLLVLVVAFYVSPYTNLFFLLLTFLSSLYGWNVLWTWRNLAGVEARLVDPGPVAAGTRIAVEIRARNTGRSRLGTTPRLQIEIRTRLPRRAITEATVHEGPWYTRPLLFASYVPRVRTAVVVDVLRAEDGEIARAGSLPSCRRGIHELDRTVVSSSFPLGLVRASRRIEGPARLVVHPAPTDLQRGGGSAGSEGAEEVLAHVEAAQNNAERSPAGLRAFRRGDEMRMLDWRATARRTALADDRAEAHEGWIVREYEAERARCLEVVLDRRIEDTTDFESALSLLAALALRQHQRKQALVVHSQGLSGTWGEDGGKPIRELLEWLAACEPLPPSAAAPDASASPDAIRLPRTSAAPAGTQRAAIATRTQPVRTPRTPAGTAP
jgi:uncharacterized protein (DUF58 family)